MNIEQGCQSLSGFAKCDGWKSTGRVLSVHILLNDPGPLYVGRFRNEIHVSNMCANGRVRPMSAANARENRYLSVLSLIKCGEHDVRFFERGAHFRAGQRIQFLAAALFQARGRVFQLGGTESGMTHELG